MSRHRSGVAGRPRGAALLLALVVLTIVATLAAGMTWRQWRAIAAESAERDRLQAHWILGGALDWARLILREDARSGGADHLGEPWAVPLAEARLADFLAAGAARGGTGSTAGGEAGEASQGAVLQAFLAGRIEDAQARYNLRNLIDGNQVMPAERAILRRLFAQAGSGAGQADAVAEALRQAWAGGGSGEGGGASGTSLVSDDVRRLGWLGLDPTLVQRLQAWVVILPARTTVNLNTAPAEVLMAVAEGLEPGAARRIIEQRTRQPFSSVDQAGGLLPRDKDGQFPPGLSVASGHFEVTGRLRLGDRIFEERSLLVRRQLEVVVLRREAVPATPDGSPRS